jgi:hypothetical protein
MDKWNTNLGSITQHIKNDDTITKISTKYDISEVNKLFGTQ